MTTVVATDAERIADVELVVFKISSDSCLSHCLKILKIIVIQNFFGLYTVLYEPLIYIRILMKKRHGIRSILYHSIDNLSYQEN